MIGRSVVSDQSRDVKYVTNWSSSPGKAQTAAVKRDAEIGVAQANRDAGIREAECEKAAMDVKYNTDTKIEDNSRAFKLQKANFDKEVNTAVRIAYEKVSNVTSIVGSDANQANALCTTI